MSKITPPLVNNGNSLLTLKQFKDAPLDFMINKTIENGPIFRLKVYNQFITVVTNRCAEKILENEEQWLNRNGLFDTFKSETGVDVFSPQGEEHRNLRSIMAVPFSRFLSAQFVDEMDSLNRSYMDIIRQDTDLLTIAKRIAINSATSILSPTDNSDLVEDLIPFSDNAMYVLTKQRPRFFLKNPIHLLRKRKVFKRIDKIIKLHRSGRFENNQKLSLIDSCINQGLSDEVTRSICIYAVSGANAYLGSFITFMLYEILRNPNLEKNILGEIGSLDYSDKSRVKKFRSLPHLRATYYETLRRYPLLAGQAFNSKVDIIADEYMIPAGDIVLIAPHLRHFDSNFFPDPLSFRYERCLPQNSEHMNEYAFKPFGLGGRMCAAIGLNEIIILNSVIFLLYNYKIKLKNISTLFKVKYDPLLTPDTKLPIELTRRNQNEKDSLKIPSLISVAPDFSDPFSSENKNFLKSGSIIEFKENKVVIKEGTDADSYWVILSGKAEVLQKNKRVAILTEGNGFGEEGLLKKLPRNATVKTLEQSKLIKIPGEDFLKIISLHNIDGNEICSFIEKEYFKTFSKGIFSNLEGEKVYSIFKDSSVHDFNKNDVIIEEGGTSDALFFIIKGNLEVYKTFKSTTNILATLGPGDFFGELGIINNEKRSSSVRAKSPCKILKIPKETYLELVDESEGLHKDVLKTATKRIISSIE